MIGRGNNHIAVLASDVDRESADFRTVFQTLDRLEELLHAVPTRELRDGFAVSGMSLA